MEMDSEQVIGPASLIKRMQRENEIAEVQKPGSEAVIEDAWQRGLNAAREARRADREGEA